MKDFFKLLALGLISLLERKGIFCSILGIVVMALALAPALMKHWDGIDLTNAFLIQTAVLTGLGLIITVLPSKFILEFWKGKLIMED